MKAIRGLLHLYSYLFHLVLFLFLAGIALVGLLSSSTTFTLAAIPWWTGRTLQYVALASGAAGIASVILAARGKLRVLFFLWAVVVSGVVFQGYFFGDYRYDDSEHFQRIVWFAGGALLAAVGAFSRLRSR